MLRVESKVRARALQLLYAWEQQQRPPVRDVADRALRLCRGARREWNAAEALAGAVASNAAALDDEIAVVAEHWRLPRIGLVERNILRLGIHELERSDLPAPVVITEALRLARWFAGAKAVPFVNGVLDQVARRRGRL